MKPAGYVGAIVCALAGFWLFLWDSAGQENNWFEVVTRGLGVYFVGKALFIVSTTLSNDRQLRELKRIAGPEPTPSLQPAASSHTEHASTPV